MLRSKQLLDVQSSGTVSPTSEQAHNGILIDAEEAEKRTEYSKDTTFQPGPAQRCMSEICQDIYGKISAGLTIQTWPSVSRRLPDLIKAFAVKIGSEESSPLHLRTMHFIHSHHWYVYFLVFQVICQVTDV